MSVRNKIVAKTRLDLTGKTRNPKVVWFMVIFCEEKLKARSLVKNYVMLLGGKTGN